MTIVIASICVIVIGMLLAKLKGKSRHKGPTSPHFDGKRFHNQTGPHQRHCWPLSNGC